MNTKTGIVVNFQFMAVLAIIVGLAGIVLQFLPGFGLLTFVLTVAVLGGLISGNDQNEKRAIQQPEQSYKLALEWLLLTFMAAYAVIEVSKWFNIFEPAAAFLNDHWTGLTLALMCCVMGIAVLQNASKAGSA